GELHATALASSTGVDLGLHHPDVAAERLGGLDRLVDRETGDAPGHRDPVLAQDLLALVLVDIHRRSSKDCDLSPERRTPRTRRLAAPATWGFRSVRARGIRGVCGRAGHCSDHIRTLRLAKPDVSRKSSTASGAAPAWRVRVAGPGPAPGRARRHARRAGRSGLRVEIGVEGLVVIRSAPTDDAAHDIAAKAARREKAGLAQPFGRIGRWPPEATRPDLARPRVLGPVERGQVLADEFVRQIVLAQLLPDAGGPEAIRPAMDDGFGEALAAQQALGLERVEQGVELLGRLGMGSELAPHLDPAVLPAREVGKRTGAQAARPARPPGGFRAGWLGCFLVHHAAARAPGCYRIRRLP